MAVGREKDVNFVKARN